MTTIEVPLPDRVEVQLTPDGPFVAADRTAVGVQLTADDAALRVEVATSRVVSRVRLRWASAAPQRALVLGDAWERSYGELEWRAVRGERVLPWYALVHSPDAALTSGFGVMVRTGSFAFWQVDDHGVSLLLDLRSGGAAVRPGDRVIHAATVVFSEHTGTAFAAQRELMAALCHDPLSAGPLVGANNWYYAYGQDFDLDAVVRDARTVSELAGDHPVRPFGVIDDGWSPDGTADGLDATAGPWDRGRATFGAMDEAAAAIAEQGARPGLWYRPLVSRDRSLQGRRGEHSGVVRLDPTSPAVLDRVSADLQRFRSWGYELVKHDFSSFDLTGTWGPSWGAEPGGGPALLDGSCTTAEALVGLYRTILAAADGALVLGCNVVGHLAAGLVHAQRIGDDTSGREWDRTRRIGVNTLAFRLAQHGTFFTADADCVPSTPQTDWSLNRQFLDLIARSGTALFVSVDPRTRTPAVDNDLAAALRLALDGGIPGGVEPLDWLTSPTPSRWRGADGTTGYHWVADGGVDPFEQPRFQTYPS